MTSADSFEGFAHSSNPVRWRADSVRRLFSTFARGLPGIGLLVMRLVAGTAFIAKAAATLQNGPSSAIPAAVLAIIAGLLLVPGLWTPLAGALGATSGIWSLFTPVDDPLSSVLLATIAVGLALVGPGAWSIDSRLFGWKLIDVRHRPR